MHAQFVTTPVQAGDPGLASALKGFGTPGVMRNGFVMSYQLDRTLFRPIPSVFLVPGTTLFLTLLRRGETLILRMPAHAFRPAPALQNCWRKISRSCFGIAQRSVKISGWCVAGAAVRKAESQPGGDAVNLPQRSSQNFAQHMRPISRC